MDITTNDLGVFVYTLGVMVSGLWIGSPGQFELTPPLIALVAAAAIGWTAYFNWRLLPVLVASEIEDEEDGDEDDPIDAGESREDARA